MSEQWLANEVVIRLGVTFGLLVLLVLAEFVIPRKGRVQKRRTRWVGNGLLQLSNLLVIRFALPWIVPTSIAALVAQKGIGIFNWLAISEWAIFGLSILVLDLAIYWQHRLMHVVPVLWRLHKVHHADVDVDVTTALRFHPLEIIFSLGIKSTVVWIFGIPVEAIILFALLLNGMAMFNHANINLPLRLDRALRYFVVTPDMHRIHHSVIRREQDSNFGFNLSCWDRLFSSYRKLPEHGQQKMLLGLYETNGQNTGSVIWMLKQPFARIEDSVKSRR